MQMMKKQRYIRIGGWEWIDGSGIGGGEGGMPEEVDIKLRVRKFVMQTDRQMFATL